MSEQDPRATEQEPELDLGDALSAEFDRMATEGEEVDEIPEEDDAKEVAEVHEEPADSGEEPEASSGEAEGEPELEFNEPAPERWPAEMKQVYNQLPPQAKKAMLEGVFKPMQREYTKTTQELAEMRRNIEPMLGILQQHQQTFQRYNMDPVQALQHQMAWAAHLAQVGPEQGLKDMQAAYGLSAQGQQEADEPYLTPVERAMKADLDALKQQLGQTSQQQQSWQEQQQQQQQMAYVQAVRSELNSFCSETKDGKPVHPHIERVAPAVAGIIRGGLIPKTDEYGQPVSIYNQMKQAYNMACRLDPSISSASGTDRGQVKRAAAAQRSGVVAKAPAGDTSVPDKSLGESIEDLYDQLARTG